MSNILNDIELIDRLNARDKNAIEIIFRRFYPELCYYSYRIIDDSDAARDIVQDIFMKLYENRKYRFENIYALRTFFYRSVRNGAVDYIRQRNKSRSAMGSKPFEPEAAETDFEMFEIESQVYIKLNEAIEKLPQRCRQIFEMSYVYRMPVRSIAQTLGVAETTVKTQKQRAIKFLKQWMQDN